MGTKILVIPFEVGKYSVIWLKMRNKRQNLDKYIAVTVHVEFRNQIEGMRLRNERGGKKPWETLEAVSTGVKPERGRRPPRSTGGRSAQPTPPSALRRWRSDGDRGSVFLNTRGGTRGRREILKPENLQVLTSIITILCWLAIIFYHPSFWNRQKF